MSSYFWIFWIMDCPLTWYVWIGHWLVCNTLIKQDGVKRQTKLLIPVMSILMNSQRAPCSEFLSTKTTGNGNPNNIICFKVVSYICPVPLLSAHIANPCLSCAMAIIIFACRYHWFRLLVQALHTSIVGCLVCKGNCSFTHCFWNFTFIFVQLGN